MPLLIPLLSALLLPNTLQADIGDGTDDGTEGFLFDAFVTLDDEAMDAVKRIQEWLAANQRPDGSWNTPHGSNNTGVIAYAILALMVTGDVPGEGRFAKEIGLGVQFLLNAQRDSGLIVADGNTHAPMYQHAVATVTLAEVYGMTQNPRIREALIRAVNLTVDCQGPNGGWRYQPRRESGDTSATVMQVMALRAAAESGIHVPGQTIDRAAAFIKGCYIPDVGGFGYMGQDGVRVGCTAASLVSLQSLGLHDDPMIPDVIEYLLRETTGDKDPDHFWYTHYYASIGFYHYGGDAWRTYYTDIKKRILNEWMPEFPQRNRNVLDASWVVLVLGVPNRYLPIYQR